MSLKRLDTFLIHYFHQQLTITAAVICNTATVSHGDCWKNLCGRRQMKAEIVLGIMMLPFLVSFQEELKWPTL